MARKLIVEIVGNSDSLEKALGRAGTSAGGFGSKMASLGKVAVVAGAAITAGIGAGVVSSAKAAIDFEREMRNVNSIAKLGQNDFKALGKSVTDMAAEVGQKPKVLAAGLYDIVSSGFKASDAVKVLRVSAKAATAGLTDTATASRAVTAALNAYHQGADKARGVSDILFQTVNKGVLTFDELSNTMGDLVPASAPLGISLEEVGAGMATLTLQGVSADEAATRLKNAMVTLAKPTPALSKLLKEQGYETGTAAVKALGFAGVLDLLSKATNGSVAAQAALTPNIRTLLGVVGLTGKNLKTYNENLAAMKTAQEGAGITSQVFAEQSKSVSVQWQKFSAAIDVLKIQIGQALLPALSAMLGALSELVKWLQTSGTAQAYLNDAITIAKTVFADLVSAGQTVLGFYEKHKTLVLAVGAAVVGATAAIIAITTATRIWAAAQLALNLIIEANPFVLAAVALVALGAALVVAYQRSETFRNIVNKAFNDVKAVVLPIVKALEDAWTRWGATITRVVTAAFKAAKQIVMAEINAIRDVIRITLDVIHGNWGKAWGDLKKLVVDAFSGLPKLVLTALEKVAVFAGKEAVKIGEAIVSGILSGVASLPGKLAGALGSGITGAYHKAGDLLHGSGEFESSRHVIGEPIARGIVAGTDGLDAALSAALVKQVKSATERAGIAADVTNASRTIGLKQAQAIASGFVDTAPSVEQQIKTALVQAVAAAQEAARQKVLDSRSAFSSAFDSLASSALSAFDAKMSTWVSPAQKLLDKMQLKDQANAAKQAVKDAGAGVSEAQAGVLAAAGGSPQDEAAARAALLAAQQQYDAAVRAQQEFTLGQLAAKQTAAHAATIAKQRESLARQLLDLQQSLAKHPGEWAEASNKVIALLKKYDVPMFTAGQRFASQFADGLSSGIGAVEKAAHDLANALAKYVPHSPAKTGPLSKFAAYDVGRQFGLDFSGGVAIGLYAGKGMSAFAMPTAGVISGAVQPAPVPVSPFGAAGIAGGVGGGGDVYVTVQGWVGNDQDIAARVQKELIRYGKRNTSIFSGNGVTA